MGKSVKSPGRWIKKALFGKNSSKSHTGKGRERTANQKELLVSAKADEDDMYSAPPVISDPIPVTTILSERHLELENQESVDSQNNGGNQDGNSEVSMPQRALSDEEKIRQEEAATLAQAAFRGYLARRAFRALKGITRLQALIRGHLVRRQAVVTLCCMLGIVKLQALTRGMKVRNSDVGLEINKKFSLVKHLDGKLGDPRGGSVSIQRAKLSANVFVLKLVATSPTVMPLHLSYDSEEPNSVPNWLDRWTVSNFWKPIPQPKKIPNPKSRRQSNGQMETETGRPKRSVRRVPPANIDNSSELEKPKRNFRKISSHPADTVQENPQLELEKVKRNLRKVHNPVPENAAQPEVEAEKPKDSLDNTSGTPIDNLSVQNSSNSVEKMKKEIPSNSVEKTKKEISNISNSGEKMKKEITNISNSGEKMKKEISNISNSGEKTKKEMSNISNSGEKTKKEIQNTSNSGEKPKKEMQNTSNSAEITIDPLEVTGEIHSDQAVVNYEPQVENCGKDENTPVKNGELNHKDELMEDGNNKLGKTASNLRKQERVENGLQSSHSPSVPSYMAATESAKAKLRAQGSPRLSQDGAEKSNSARRHSLPSSANSKISSHSPRTTLTVNSGGKGKSDRSASREGNGKATQAEWKR